MLWLAAVISLLLHLAVVSSQEAPEFRPTPDEVSDELRGCLAEGNSMDFCLEGVFLKLRRSMKYGYPELGIKKTDPMFIEELDFSLVNPPLVEVTALFTNVTLTGLSTYNLKYIRANKQKKTISMKIHVNEINSNGHYFLGGVVFNVPLTNSSNLYKATYKDVTLEGSTYLDVKPNGELFVASHDLTVDVKGINLKLKDLFGGTQPILAKTVLNFVNKPESTKDFIKDFQPEISKQVGDVLAQFIESGLRTIDSSLFV